MKKISITGKAVRLEFCDGTQSTVEFENDIDLNFCEIGNVKFIYFNNIACVYNDTISNTIDCLQPIIGVESINSKIAIVQELGIIILSDSFNIENTIYMRDLIVDYKIKENKIYFLYWNEKPEIIDFAELVSTAIDSNHNN